MKTVSGTVVSSKAVSLSKATRILSKFASSDNGASPAFAAYLKRASASFNELVQLHKKFKGPGSEHKGKKLRSTAISNEVMINSVKRPSEDGLLTEEKQWSSGLKKQRKGGRRDEGEAKELEGSLKIDGEVQKDKKRRDDVEGSVGMKREVLSSEGIDDRNVDHVCGDGKKLKIKRESDEAIVDNVMGVDGVKNETVRQDGIRDTKKKMDKAKENTDGASNRIASEIQRLDAGKETTEKKKRDKGKKEKFDGHLKIEEEERCCPPGQDATNQEATKFMESDGSEHKKFKKKKKKGKEEKESGSIEGAEQKDQSAVDDGNVDEFRVDKNQLNIESGEGKKHKNQNHEGDQKRGEGKVEIKEANENLTRKRKHKGDTHGGLDYSEEQHRPKKKK